jgi:hypothetical protein
MAGKNNGTDGEGSPRAATGRGRPRKEVGEPVVVASSLPVPPKEPSPKPATGDMWVNLLDSAPWSAKSAPLPPVAPQAVRREDPVTPDTLSKGSGAPIWQTASPDLLASFARKPSLLDVVAPVAEPVVVAESVALVVEPLEIRVEVASVDDVAPVEAAVVVQEAAPVEDVAPLEVVVVAPVEMAAPAEDVALIEAAVPAEEVVADAVVAVVEPPVVAPPVAVSEPVAAFVEAGLVVDAVEAAVEAAVELEAAIEAEALSEENMVTEITVAGEQVAIPTESAPLVVENPGEVASVIAREPVEEASVHGPNFAVLMADAEAVAAFGRGDGEAVAKVPVTPPPAVVMSQQKAKAACKPAECGPCSSKPTHPQNVVVEDLLPGVVRLVGDGVKSIIGGAGGIVEGVFGGLRRLIPGQARGSK